MVSVWNACKHPSSDTANTHSPWGVTHMNRKSLSATVASVLKVACRSPVATLKTCNWGDWLQTKSVSGQCGKSRTWDTVIVARLGSGSIVCKSSAVLAFQIWSGQKMNEWKIQQKKSSKLLWQFRHYWLWWYETHPQSRWRDWHRTGDHGTPSQLDRISDREPYTRRLSTPCVFSENCTVQFHQSSTSRFDCLQVERRARWYLEHGLSQKQLDTCRWPLQIPIFVRSRCLLEDIKRTWLKHNKPWPVLGPFPQQSTGYYGTRPQPEQHLWPSWFDPKQRKGIEARMRIAQLAKVKTDLSLISQVLS